MDVLFHYLNFLLVNYALTMCLIVILALVLYSLKYIHALDVASNALKG